MAQRWKFYLWVVKTKYFEKKHSKWNSFFSHNKIIFKPLVFFTDSVCIKPMKKMKWCHQCPYKLLVRYHNQGPGCNFKWIFTRFFFSVKHLSVHIIKLFYHKGHRNHKVVGDFWWKWFWSITSALLHSPQCIFWQVSPTIFSTNLVLHRSLNRWGWCSSNVYNIYCNFSIIFTHCK